MRHGVGSGEGGLSLVGEYRGGMASSIPEDHTIETPVLVPSSTVGR